MGSNHVEDSSKGLFRDGVRDGQLTEMERWFQTASDESSTAISDQVSIDVQRIEGGNTKHHSTHGRHTTL